MVVLAGSSTDSSEVLCKRKSTGVHIQSAEIVVRSFSQVRQLIQVFILVIFGSNGNFSCVGFGHSLWQYRGHSCVFLIS